MNKKLLIIIVGLGILGVFVYMANKSDELKTNTNASESSASADFTTISDACKLFTLESAQKVIGSSAQADTAVSQNVDSGDTIVTACTYTNTEDADNKLTASLLISSPKTTASVSSNQTPFTSAKPKNAQTVNDLGENAYWDPALGQLNVLHKGNWLIFTAGPTQASDRTPDLATQTAKIVLAQI